MHTLSSGSRLEAAESVLPGVEKRTVAFGQPFVRRPAVLTCMQGAPYSLAPPDTTPRASLLCGEASEEGFSIRLDSSAAGLGTSPPPSPPEAPGPLSPPPSPSAAASEAGAAGGSMAEAEAGEAGAGEAQGEAGLEPVGDGARDDGQVSVEDAGVMVDSAGLPRDPDERDPDEAVVGWIACDCQGGDMLLTGLLNVSEEWREVRFSIEYQETPVFMASLMGTVGGRATGWPPTARTLGCERRDSSGVWAQCSSTAGGEAATLEQMGWLALPAGKLWVLETYEYGPEYVDDAMTAASRTTD